MDFKNCYTPCMFGQSLLPFSFMFQIYFFLSNLPCFVFSGKYLRQKRIDFQLPYDILWLWKHDQVINHIVSCLVFLGVSHAHSQLLISSLKMYRPTYMLVSVSEPSLFFYFSFTKGRMSPFIKRSDQVSTQSLSSDSDRMYFLTLIDLCACISLFYWVCYFHFCGQCYPLYALFSKIKC